MTFGKNERAPMRCAFGEYKGCRCHIHLAVTDQNVAIAAEAPEAFVLVNVGVIGIQKAAVAQDKIEHRVVVAVRLLRVASEYVVNLPPVMLAAWYLAVAIVICFAARISKSLELKTFGKAYEAKIWIGVASG